MIALIGTMIERKVASKSRKASPSTKAKTIGIRAAIIALKSFVPAASPVTATFAPWIFSTVAGIRSLRRVESAAMDASSVPFPASGMSTEAIVPSELILTSIGSNIFPLAIACRRRLAIALVASGERISRASMTTLAGT